jgi:hypothetical protein
MPLSKAIDIHAHYFGEGYLQLFNEQSARYATEYRSTKDGWYFKSPIASVGPLPSKFIDTKQRIVEMDQQGVAVQALSLTSPMVYWAEPFAQACAGLERRCSGRAYGIPGSSRRTRNTPDARSRPSHR